MKSKCCDKHKGNCGMAGRGYAPWTCCDKCPDRIVKKFLREPNPINQSLQDSEEFEYCVKHKRVQIHEGMWCSGKPEECHCKPRYETLVLPCDCPDCSPQGKEECTCDCSKCTSTITLKLHRHNHCDECLSTKSQKWIYASESEDKQEGFKEDFKRKDWTSEQWKTSEDPIDRLVYFISYLSPHNLWKAREAVASVVDEEREKVKGKIKEYRKSLKPMIIYPSKDEVSSEMHIMVIDDILKLI